MAGPTDIELSVGIKPGDVKNSARELGKSIEDIFNKSAGEKLNSKMQKLQQQMSTTTSKAQGLIDKMTVLESKKIPTEQYTNLSKLMERLEGRVTKLGSEYVKLENGPQTEKVRARMEAITTEVDKLQDRLYRCQKNMDGLVESGKAFRMGSDTDEYTKLSDQLANVNNQSRILINNWDNMANSESNVANRSKLLSSIWTNMIANFKKLGNAAKNLVSRLFQMVSAFRLAGKSHKSFDINLKKGLMTILKYGFGIRSFYFLFRKLRAAIGDGIKAVVQWEGANGALNQSISNMQSALSTLKNNIGASFVPLINSLAPAITNLINILNDAITKISMFIGAFTGKKTILVANKVTENFAQSLDDTAKNAKKAKDAIKGYLSPLDELNKYQKDSEAAASGAGGGGATFKEVPIDSSVLDFVKQLKEMWKNKDFYNLGKMIGEQLRDALESIPWAKIRQTSNDLGKAVASLINGFVEVERLAYDIGSTIAQGINTVFEFINGFVHELHWDSIGEFIADLFNGFFETIDWPLIKDTVITGLRGVAEAINSFIENFHWENISNFISNAVNTLTAGIVEFFGTVKWDELGARLGEQLMDTIRKINWEDVGRAIGSIVQAGLDFFKNFISQLEWSEIKTKMKELVKGFFEEVNMDDIKNILVPILIGGIALSISQVILKNFGKQIFAAMFGATTEAGAIANISVLGMGFGMKCIAAVAAGVTAGLAVFEPIKGWILNESGLFDTEEARNLEAAYKGWSGTLEMLKEEWLEVWYTITGQEEKLEALKNKTYLVRDANGEVIATTDRWGNTIIDFTEETDKATDKIQDMTKYTNEYGDTVTKVGDKTSYDIDITKKRMSTSEQLRAKLKELGRSEDEINAALARHEKRTQAIKDGYGVLKDETGETTIVINDNKEAFVKAGDAAKQATDQGLKPWESSTNDIIQVVPEFNSSLQSMQGELETTSAKAKEEGDKMVSGVFGEKTAFAKASDEFFFNLWDELSSGWQENQKEAEEFGTEIINGTTGCFGEKTKFAKACDTFFLTLWNILKKVFGIASPAKEMKPIGENILLGILEGFKDKFDEFKRGIQNFYENTVKPWFSADKWKFSGVAEGLKQTFETAKQWIKTPINDMLGFIEKFVNGIVDGFNTLGGKLGDFKFDIPDSLADKFNLPSEFKLSLPKLSHVSLPRLAQGAVIPPNKEFMAVLGDQKQGTNIETPLATMVDAFRQVMREMGGNTGTTTIQIITPDKQKLAEYVVEGGRVTQMSTGRNIFELAGG